MASLHAASVRLCAAQSMENLGLVEMLLLHTIRRQGVGILVWQLTIEIRTHYDLTVT